MLCLCSCSSWRWACQRPKHVEDNVTYMFILKCALKLVLKNILYYDARSEKHQIIPKYVYTHIFEIYESIFTTPSKAFIIIYSFKTHFPPNCSCKISFIYWTRTFFFTPWTFIPRNLRIVECRLHLLSCYSSTLLQLFYPFHPFFFPPPPSQLVRTRFPPDVRDVPE